MYDGWLQLAGNEVINVARTMAYVQSGYVPAGVNVQDCIECGSLGEMLGDKEYASPMLDEAPWFESGNPDTWDFAGVLPLEITGLNGSTRKATVTEMVSDGGAVAGVRFGSRTIAVTALLLGKTTCAVEAGLAWLSTVLGGSKCSGPPTSAARSACEGDELCVLTCCPDELADVPVPGQVATDTIPVHSWAGEGGFYDAADGVMEPNVRAAGSWTNLMPNPSFEIDTSGWSATGATIARSTIDWPSMWAAASLLATTALSPVRTNLATNPGLEAGGTTGWTSNDPAKYPIANSTTSPITGTRSIMSTRQSSGLDSVAGSVYLSDAAGARLPVTAGEVVTAAIDVKTENPAVVEATNLTFNPVGPGVATIAGNYWVPSRGTLSAVSDFLRLTITDASATVNAQRFNTPQSFAAGGSILVTPGQVVRGVGQVRSSGSFTMACTLQFFDASNALVGGSNVSPTRVTNPTTWTELEMSAVAPAGAAWMQVQFGIYSTEARAINDTIDLQRVYIGQAMAPSPWFDGSTAASGDYTHRWTGAVNASTSERVRANPPVKTVVATNGALYPNLENGAITGWNSNNAAIYPVSLDTTAPISGTYSAMSTRLAASPNGQVASINLGNGSGVRFPCTPGAPATFSLDVKTDPASTGTRNVNTSFLWYDAVDAPLGQSPNVTTPVSTPGAVTRIVGTATPPAGAVRCYPVVSITMPSGNAPTGERAWFDSLNYGGSTYFDGSTPASGGYLYRWTGARNISTSERYTETPRLRKIRVYYAYDVGGNSPVTTVNDVAPGAVTRVVHSATVPAGATSAYVIVSVETMSGSATVGERVWYDNLIVERGSAATDGSYFDGATPDTTRYDYAWTGAANASTSTRTEQAVIISGPVVPVSQAYTNITLRVGTAVDTQARFTLQVRWSNGTTTVGQMSEVNFNSYAVLSGSFARPAAATTAQVQVVVQAPSAGVPAAGSGIYLDAVIVADETSARHAAYIDGDMTDVPGTTFVWNGTPHASSSTATTTPQPISLTGPVIECIDEAVLDFGVSTLKGPVRLQAQALALDGSVLWTGPWIDVSGVAPAVRIMPEEEWGDWVPKLNADPAKPNPFEIAPVLTHAKYKSAEECLDEITRSYLDVTTIEGPTVVDVFESACGERYYKVEWTMVAGNPAMLGPIVPFVTRMSSDNAGGFGAHAAEFSTAYQVTTGIVVDPVNDIETACVTTAAPALLDVFDPCCTGFLAPPSVPYIADSCFDRPTTYHRTWIQIPKDYAPSTEDGLLSLEVLNDGQSKRGLRIRVYPDPIANGISGLVECDFCDEFFITYIPPNATWRLDGPSRRVTTQPSGRMQQIISSASVRGRDGGPFEFPAMQCNTGYLITVDTPDQYAENCGKDCAGQPQGDVWVSASMRRASL